MLSSTFLYTNFQDPLAVNYLPLLKKIQQIIHNWSSLLNWFEWIEFIKSNILPQFLFLFQLKYCLRLFTNGRRNSTHLSGLSTLIESLRHISANHQNQVDSAFLFYDLTTQHLSFTPFIFYFIIITSFSLLQMEEFSITSHKIRDILWNKPSERPKATLANSFLKLTLTIRDKYQPVFTSLHYHPFCTNRSSLLPNSLWSSLSGDRLISTDCDIMEKWIATSQKVSRT